VRETGWESTELSAVLRSSVAAEQAAALAQERTAAPYCSLMPNASFGLTKPQSLNFFEIFYQELL
jgi:hypothetical protein